MGSVDFNGGGNSNKILNIIHKHRNLNILDCLDEARDGKLMYKGKPLLSDLINQKISAYDVIEEKDRKFVASTEKDSLSGIQVNIQAAINKLTNETKTKLTFRGFVEKALDLTKIENLKDNDIAIVTKDENNNYIMSSYIYLNTKWNRVSSFARTWTAQPVPPVLSGAPSLWVDTSDITKPILKWYSGTDWKVLTTIGGSGGSGGAGANIDDSNSSLTTTFSSIKINNLIGDFAKLDDSNTFSTKTWSSRKITSAIEVVSNEIAKMALKNHTHDAKDIAEDDLHSFLSKKTRDIVNQLSINNGKLFFNTTLLGMSAASFLDDTKSSDTMTYSSQYLEKRFIDKQNNLGFSPEDSANKNKANGYAGLDSAGIISLNIIPEILKQQTHVVNNVTERLALTDIKLGDFCYEKNLGNLYIYDGLDWILIASNKALLAQVKNNFSASVSPTASDDNTIGYSIGSLWVDRVSKKGYICIDNTTNMANWINMAGNTVLSIGEIVPFRYAKNDAARTAEQDEFIIPTTDIVKDFIEVSIDGIEVEKGKDYEVITPTKIKFNYKIRPDQEVFGEIYKETLESVEQNMRKSDYDSNKNGKVDRAEITDISKQIQSWAANTEYKKGESLVYDNSLYTVNSSGNSGNNFDITTMDLVYARPKDIKDFTTDDLKESATKLYLIPSERTLIADVPSLKNTVTNQGNSISNLISWQNAINLKIPADASASNLLITNKDLTTKITNLKFKDLIDCPHALVGDTWIKTKADASGLEAVSNPHFPIKNIKMKNGDSFNDVMNIEFLSANSTNFDTTSKTLSIKNDIFSTEIIDMPRTYEQGSILVCNKDMMRYELSKIEDLTISKENFQVSISASKWLRDDMNSPFYVDIVHDLDSDHLVVGITDINSEQDLAVKYKILDKKKIRLISDTAKDLKLTINCSLGVTNGYWTASISTAVLAMVDDTRPRTDKAYSSQKVEDLVKVYAKKIDVYKRDEADIKFADKKNEHAHPNLDALSGLVISKQNKITFNGEELLTKVEPKMYQEQFTMKDNKTLDLIFDTNKAIVNNGFKTLANSEVIIKNSNPKGNTPEEIIRNSIKLIIYDGNITLIDVDLKPQEVQKYIMGISPNTKIYVKGNFEGNVYLSAF